MADDELNLLYWDERANLNQYDLLKSLIFGYSLLIFLPTFVIDTNIVLKEMTLNQFAWNKHEDYNEANLFFGNINGDLLELFGINEDTQFYWNWVQKWCQ